MFTKAHVENAHQRVCVDKLNHQRVCVDKLNHQRVCVDKLNHQHVYVDGINRPWSSKGPMDILELLDSNSDGEITVNRTEKFSVIESSMGVGWGADGSLYPCMRVCG